MVKHTRFGTCSLSIVMVCDLINYCKIHKIKPTNALILKLYFLHTIGHNADMFQCVLKILRKLMNFTKAYIKTRMVIKYVKIRAKNVCAYYKIRLYQCVELVCSCV